MCFFFLRRFRLPVRSGWAFCMSELGINAGSVGVGIEGDGRW